MTRASRAVCTLAWASALVACSVLNPLDAYEGGDGDRSVDAAQGDGGGTSDGSMRDGGSGADVRVDAIVDAGHAEVDAEVDASPPCPAPVNPNRVLLRGQWLNQNGSTGTLSRPAFVGTIAVTLLSTDRTSVPKPSAFLSIVENASSPQNLNFDEGENGELGTNFGVAVPEVDLSTAHRAFVCVYR